MKFNTTSLTFSDVGVAQARQGKQVANYVLL